MLNNTVPSTIPFQDVGTI